MKTKKIMQQLNREIAIAMQPTERDRKRIECIKALKKLQDEGKTPTVVYLQGKTYRVEPLVSWHSKINMTTSREYLSIWSSGWEKPDRFVKIVNKRLLDKVEGIDEEITKLHNKKQRLLKKKFPDLKSVTMRKAKYWLKFRDQVKAQFGL